jgi:hypothetical protein
MVPKKNMEGSSRSENKQSWEHNLEKEKLQDLGGNFQKWEYRFSFAGTHRHITPVDTARALQRYCAPLTRDEHNT